jgi:hypothetical protein
MLFEMVTSSEWGKVLRSMLREILVTSVYVVLNDVYLHGKLWYTKNIMKSVIETNMVRNVDYFA